MPVKNETLNASLFDTLKAWGYDPISKNSKGDDSNEIEKADVFRFTAKDDKGQPIPAWATVQGNNLVLYTDDKFNKTKDFEKFTEYMKRWAQRRTLKWKPTNKDHLVHDMKKRTVMKKKEDQLYEGYHALGKKASYSDSVPQVKIILQHTRQLEEGEQRFRNIAKIFVENSNGERFLIPTNRPGLARVYARHIAEGGTPYDDKAKHISTLVEEYTKMAGFVRATRKGQFNESALRLVNEGLRHYNELRMTLQGMASHRGYNKYFESYTPVLNEESTEETNLNELFVQETLDPRIESVMPILNRLSKNITEMSAVKELEEWAESITEVEDETTKTLAEPADEMLDEAPGAETLKHNQDTEKSNLDAFDLDETDLRYYYPSATKSRIKDKIKKKFHKMEEGPADEPVEPDMDADDKRFDDVDEGVVDTLKKVGKKVVDYIAPSDEELLKDLQKKIGIPKHAQHGKPRMAVPNKELGEAYINKTADAVDVLANLRKISKNIEIGNNWEGNLANQYVNDVWDVYTWLENHANVNDPKLKPILDDIFDLRAKAKSLERQPGSGSNRELANKIVNYLYPLMQWIEMNVKDKQQDMAEDLDANQKRAGQLGPTEPVGKNEKNLRGKLVGASESTETKEEAITEMDSEGHRGHREDGDPYAKGAKATPAKAKDVAKKGAKELDKAFDKAHDSKKDVKEGQEDLEAILRIVRK